MPLRCALIADDDRLLGESLCEAFGDLGWQASAVSCAREAIEELKRRPRDLLLSDVDMPDHSGFQLLAWSLDLLPPPRVVLMSGRATSELADSARQAGAIDLLPKPVPVDRLSRIMASYFT